MLELSDVHVRYSYKTVLNGITLRFQSGRIYSLMGENGAGKTTVSKIIAGCIAPTSGKIFLDGKAVAFANPRDAINHGICCVNQRPAVASEITVRENLRLGQSHFDDDLAALLLGEWLPGRGASALAGMLSLEERFFVSLVNALLKNPRILVLDEPPDIPAEKLRALAKNGMTIILITHNLRESLQKSDEIILLRDGVVLEQKNANEVSEDYIAQRLYDVDSSAFAESDFTAVDIREDDFFAGFAGNQKIGYIPSDIAMRASNPNLTILQLLTSRHCGMRQKPLENYASNLLSRADVRIKLNEKASCLSGGMLQRLVLERELAENPKEIYLFNPTHGLDVQATVRLFSRLKKLADSGTKVFFGKGEPQQ